MVTAVDTIRANFQQTWIDGSNAGAQSELALFLQENAPQNLWSKSTCDALKKFLADLSVWFQEQETKYNLKPLEKEQLRRDCRLELDKSLGNSTTRSTSDLVINGAIFPCFVSLPHINHKFHISKCTFSGGIFSNSRILLKDCTFKTSTNYHTPITSQQEVKVFNPNLKSILKNANISGNGGVVIEKVKLSSSHITSNTRVEVLKSELNSVKINSNDLLIGDCSNIGEVNISSEHLTLRLYNVCFSNEIPDFHRVANLALMSSFYNVNWGLPNNGTEFIPKCVQLDKLLMATGHTEEAQKIKALICQSRLQSNQLSKSFKVLYRFYGRTSNFGQDYVRPLIWLFGIFVCIFAISLLYFIYTCYPLGMSLQQASALAFKSILGPLRIGFSFEFGSTGQPPYGLYIISWLASAFATYLWFSAFMVINRHVRLPSVK